MISKATAVQASLVAAQKIPVPESSEMSAVVSMLQRVCNDPAFPIERAEQAFNFMLRVQAEQAQRAWTEAFVEAASSLEQIKKEANSDKGKYASFEAIDAATRPILNRQGFQFTHTTESTGKPDEIRIVTFLLHRSGHRERYEVDMPADGKGAKGNDVMTRTHAVGSAMTYGKRYNIGNALNIATYKDDDGKAASATTRPVKEIMALDESATKRDEIMKELRTHKTPLSPDVQETFATKWGHDISMLRPDDAKKVRDEFSARRGK